jgi:hypothetical protein
MVRFSSVVFTALLTALPLTSAESAPLRSAQFVLVNKSGRTIDQFYMSPCWARNWGNNQIADTPVWTSKTFTIKDIAPGCYNLMVVLPYGNRCVISGELIEGIKAWTITQWTPFRAAAGGCSYIAHPVSAGERSQDRRDFIPMPALQ